jgi:hypothetical protein
VKKNDLGLFNKKKPSAPGPRRMTPLAGLKIKQVCIGLKSHHHMLGFLFFFFFFKKRISDMLFSLIFFQNIMDETSFVEQIMHNLLVQTSIIFNGQKKVTKKVRVQVLRP